MSKVQENALLRKWELTVCQILHRTLPVAKLAASVLFFMFLFDSHISKTQLLILWFIIIALFYLHKNVKLILGGLDDNSGASGE